MEKRGCHSKTRMSNKNSMSSPGIHSSYLYRVATRLSHISMRTILCTSSHTLSYTCQCPTVMCLCVLWKLWILQSYSWKTKHGSTISGTLKQEESILIFLQTLTNSFIYPSVVQFLSCHLSCHRQ